MATVAGPQLFMLCASCRTVCTRNDAGRLTVAWSSDGEDGVLVAEGKPDQAIVHVKFEEHNRHQIPFTAPMRH